LKHTSKYTRKSCGGFLHLYNFALLKVWTNFSIQIDVIQFLGTHNHN